MLREPELSITEEIRELLACKDSTLLVWFSTSSKAELLTQDILQNIDTIMNSFKEETISL
jgi:succinate dehydrogenase flavin-adding protein (antitoxin of CptAB toxin-antitoxin module)